MKSAHQPQISIIDDSRFLAKSSKVNKLDKYSISKNKEGVFILDFSVKKNVRVDFVFNEASKIHEIHLEQGKSPKTVFSRVLEKVDGQALKFDFINHNNTFKTGDDPDDPDGLEVNRKPRIIII